MNILFLAHNYLGLAQPIIDEMERQGHYVFYVEDKALPTDCYHKNNLKILNKIKMLYNRLFKIYEKYWKEKFKIDKRFSNHFDLLFCIQGLSFHPILLNYLKIKNPHIKTSLYIWDTNRFYDFFRNASFFEKVFTFDLDDSHENKDVGFLPFYWTENSRVCCDNAQYDLSMVGTDHDGRYEIVKNVYCNVRNQLTTCFKIVIPKYPFDMTKRLRFTFLTLFRYRKIALKLKNWQSKMMLPIYTFDYLEPEYVNDIIQCSKCILDTDRETQTGTTPRVIWALAMGKKIISTNKHLLEMSFVDKQQIRIIDRNNPVIDIDFVKSDISFAPSEYVQSLRLDKWIMNFIC